MPDTKSNRQPQGKYLLSGPDLDKLYEETRQWYVASKLRLIEELSDPYPYNSDPLDEMTQAQNYLALTPETLLQMRAALGRVYQGHPDAINLVENELQKYFNRMEELVGRLGIPRGGQNYA